MKLAACFGQWLALLAHRDSGEIVAMGGGQIEPVAQQLRAGFGGGGTPTGERSVRNLVALPTAQGLP